VREVKIVKDNIMRHVRRKITERYEAKVETVYCLEHDQFARWIIVDEENRQWQIEGCCSNLIEKAKAAIGD
jgi:hypothetical protein